VCVCVQIVGERHVGEGFTPDLVVARRYYLWRHAFFGCFEGGRSAVHVRAGDHCDFVADDSVIPGKDVGWDVHACDVAEMGFAVYVRPCDGDKNFTRQVNFRFVTGLSETAGRFRLPTMISFRGLL
jgi:hypothetical protein